MDNKYSIKYSLFDNQAMKEAMSRLNETTQILMESMQRVHEVTRPLIEAIEKNSHRLLESGKVITEAASKVLRPFDAIRKIGEAQFVYWDYMNTEMVDDIIASEDVDDTLLQHMIQDKFQRVNRTIKELYNSNLINKHHNLYHQSINAFQKDDYDIAVVGLTSLFDGLLADVSNNTTHQMPPRIAIIMEKFEKEKVLNHDEYAILILALTFEKTLDSFCKASHFSEEEPNYLNRHWIAHGRSIRDKTKLDCVKMINLIYGLLLVEELDNPASSE